MGPMETLGKRASWRKGLLIDNLLCDQVVRFVTFTDSLLCTLFMAFMFGRKHQFICQVWDDLECINTIEFTSRGYITG